MLSRREQVVIRICELQEPLFGCRMRLDRAVVEDMADARTAHGERTRHQKAAMAIERLALGTHQAEAMPPGIVQQTLKTGLEARLPRHGFVIGDFVTGDASQ